MSRKNLKTVSISTFTLHRYILQGLQNSVLPARVLFQLPTEDEPVALPVMIYIHGGGFVGGTARGAYAERIINEDVVYAAINYRLGPFGIWYHFFLVLVLQG
jgi:acetyl esterase/lipase